MSALLALPKSAPFATDEIEVLNRLVTRSTPQQRTWLAGFFAGLEAATTPAAAPAAPPRARTPLTILYATESGNTEGLALKARSAAQKLGFDARAVDMADASVDSLAKVQNLIVIASTWGEGDPPQRAVDFHTALMSDAAPRLEGVKFAVLALGDTAYVNFCSVGRAIDERLSALGASRAADRIDCDLDFAKRAADWTAKTLSVLAPKEAESSATVVHVDFKGHGHAANTDEPLYSAENPLEAEITSLVNLSGTGSTRESWHVELGTEVHGYAYEPGDAIGIAPENAPEAVAALLDATGLGGDAALAAELVAAKDVTTLTRPIVDAYAKLTGRTDVAAFAEPATFAAFAADRQLVDLFSAYPDKLDAGQLKALLRPLPPRLYSVASSTKAHAGETHLLVGAVRWQSHGRERNGVASTLFADRRKVGDRVKVYVKPNRHFRLPDDGDRPILMIGAGTGVAPYRGFVADRAETGAKGRSWLVFGERNYSLDFLYQLEWQEHLANGALSRIDVAFSRDQPEKIYVQHKLWDSRDDVIRWIEDGAHIYVCGDEKGMGRDVDATLVRILAETVKGDLDAGRAKLADLRRAGRYQRDVY